MIELLKLAVSKGYEPAFFYPNGLFSAILTKSESHTCELSLIAEFCREKGIDVWVEPVYTTSDDKSYRYRYSKSVMLIYAGNEEAEHITAFIAGLTKALEEVK